MPKDKTASTGTITTPNGSTYAVRFSEFTVKEAPHGSQFDDFGRLAMNIEYSGVIQYGVKPIPDKLHEEAAAAFVAWMFTGRLRTTPPKNVPAAKWLRSLRDRALRRTGRRTRLGKRPKRKGLRVTFKSVGPVTESWPVS